MLEFDKWFNKQSTLIKALLLLIPGVNWVCECLVRLSVMLRTKQPVHIIVFVLFIAVGWGWFLGAIDFVYMLLKGHLFLAE
ncbi:MAG: hypothetical protein E7349_02095 [Clostridiales bacterium]|nr:hypothetical protein [Clostridiales bacterium]